VSAAAVTAGALAGGRGEAGFGSLDWNDVVFGLTGDAELAPNSWSPAKTPVRTVGAILPRVTVVVLSCETALPLELTSAARPGESALLPSSEGRTKDLSSAELDFGKIPVRFSREGRIEGFVACSIVLNADAIDVSLLL
jgi:hypothetical protein